MVLVKSNSQLEKEEKEEKEESEKNTGISPISGTGSDSFKQSLAGFLHTHWDEARRSKITLIEPQMVANLRQAMGIYDDTKLAAIKRLGAGSAVNLNQTGVKCFNAMAWVSDILFPPHGKCWGVTPTPVPELDSDLLAQADAAFSRSALGAATSGDNPVDMGSTIQDIQSKLPSKNTEMQDELKGIVDEIAEKKATQMERAINDKLVEGKWYSSLQECLYDLIYIKTGFIKGPMLRTRNKRVVKTDPSTGKKAVTTESTTVNEYERRSPFDIYPEPDSTGIDDGYLFDHVSYRHKDLMALRGLDGFQTDAINRVLIKYATGGLHEWTGIESERALLEKKDTQSVYQSSKIDGLEYYGPVPGSILLEWGLTAEEVPDPAATYEIRAAMIDNEIIQAVLNPDPFGRKPYAKASYEEQNDSFWGKALPEKISAPVSVVNAAARAMVNNLGMGSGPQVEINVDRLIGGEKGDTRLIPWRRWLTHNRSQQTGKAIEFFSPNMHSQEIMTVIKDFSRIIDEHGGIPGYAHGDLQVGGAGNTASGLSMLITQASRAIKSVIRNIDINLIVPTIQYMYDDMIGDESGQYIDLIGDIKLVAKGSVALIEKEQRAIRMLELLGASENPYAAQVIGPKGFKYLWSEVAKSYDMEPDNVVTGEANVNMNPPGMEAGGAPGAAPPAQTGTPAAPVALDSAGSTPSGADTQLITGQGGHPSL